VSLLSSSPSPVWAVRWRCAMAGIRKRLMLALGSALVAATLVTGVAAAVAPTREFAPTPPSALDYSCGYEILVTWPINREYSLQFYDRDGNPTRFIITGAQFVTFTNTATSESLTVNASGTGHFGFTSGSSVEGRNAGTIPGYAGL